MAFCSRCHRDCWLARVGGALGDAAATKSSVQLGVAVFAFRGMVQWTSGRGFCVVTQCFAYEWTGLNDAGNGAAKKGFFWSFVCVRSLRNVGLPAVLPCAELAGKALFGKGKDDWRFEPIQCARLVSVRCVPFYARKQLQQAVSPWRNRLRLLLLSLGKSYRASN